MKTIQRLAFAGLTVCLALSSRAQVLVFSGHVTSATGIFAGLYSDSTLVSLSLDFTHSVARNPGASYGYASYSAPYQFLIGGENFLLLPPSETSLVVDLYRTPSFQGLSIAEGYTPDYFLSPDHHGKYIYQSILTTQEVGVTRNIFPEGIPFDKFSHVEGRHDTSEVVFYDNHITGTINWSMDSYTGSLALPDLTDLPPPPLTAVPEPSTYGFVGALSLLAIVVHRKFKQPSFVSGKMVSQRA